MREWRSGQTRLTVNQFPEKGTVVRIHFPAPIRKDRACHASGSQPADHGQDFLEKYSSGLRGTPAKSVGRESGAGVRIPASPPCAGLVQWKNLCLVSTRSEVRVLQPAPLFEERKKRNGTLEC